MVSKLTLVDNFQYVVPFGRCILNLVGSNVLQTGISQSIINGSAPLLLDQGHCLGRGGLFVNIISWLVNITPARFKLVHPLYSKCEQNWNRNYSINRLRQSLLQQAELIVYSQN